MEGLLAQHHLRHLVGQRLGFLGDLVGAGVEGFEVLFARLDGFGGGFGFAVDLGGAAFGEAGADGSDALLDGGLAHLGGQALLTRLSNRFGQALLLGEVLVGFLVPLGARLHHSLLFLLDPQGAALQAQLLLQQAFLQAQGVNGRLIGGSVAGQCGGLVGCAPGQRGLHISQLFLGAGLRGAPQAQHEVPCAFGCVAHQTPAFLQQPKAAFQRLGAFLRLGQRGVGGHGGGFGGAALRLQGLDLFVHRQREETGLLVELQRGGQRFVAQCGKALGGFFRGGAAGALQFNGGQRDAFQRAGGDVTIGGQRGQHFSGTPLRAGHIPDALGHLIQRAGGGAGGVARERERLDVGVHLAGAQEGGGAQRGKPCGRQAQRADERAQEAAHAPNGVADAAVSVLDLPALLDEDHPRRHAAGQAGDHIGHLHGELAVGLAQQVGLHPGIARHLRVVAQGLAHGGHGARHALGGLGHLAQVCLYLGGTLNCDLDADVVGHAARPSLASQPTGRGWRLACGLLRGFALAPVGPHVQGGALSGLDAAPDVAPGIKAALDVLLVQVGAHARVVQPCGAGHADTPLCVDALPAFPCLHVVRPQVCGVLRLGVSVVCPQAQAGQGSAPGSAGVRERGAVMVAGLGDFAGQRG